MPAKAITSKKDYRELGGIVGPSNLSEIMSVRLLVCHRTTTAGACVAQDGRPWIELDKIDRARQVTALCFAATNNTKRLMMVRGGRGRRLPPEIIEMVLCEFLVEHVYACMGNNDVMGHLGHIPTGLPPLLKVRLPVIFIRNPVLVQLTPEELAGACVETTVCASDANLTLQFLTSNDGGNGDEDTLQTLHYKFLSSRAFN
jgi:hypothetical protein